MFSGTGSVPLTTPGILAASAPQIPQSKSPSSISWPLVHFGCPTSVGCVVVAASGRQPSGRSVTVESGQPQTRLSTSPSQNISSGALSVLQLGQSRIMAQLLSVQLK